MIEQRHHVEHHVGATENGLHDLRNPARGLGGNLGRRARQCRLRAVQRRLHPLRRVVVEQPDQRRETSSGKRAAKRPIWSLITGTSSSSPATSRQAAGQHDHKRGSQPRQLQPLKRIRHGIEKVGQHDTRQETAA
jgi:hypothetical protein